MYVDHKTAIFLYCKWYNLQQMHTGKYRMIYKFSICVIPVVILHAGSLILDQVPGAVVLKICADMYLYVSTFL